MKNRLFLAGMLGMILTFGILTISCKDDEEKNEKKNLKYSVQVNNRAASRAIAAEDSVELYIRGIDVWVDGGVGEGLWLVSDGHAFADGGDRLNNAGWFSVSAQNFVSYTSPDNVSYSVVEILIDKLRVNGTEYDFPDSGKKYGERLQILLGSMPTHPVPGAVWKDYPDNFSGFTITDSTDSLKLILTVEPDIIDCWDQDGNLTQDDPYDPYKFIKFEGRINE